MKLLRVLSFCVVSGTAGAVDLESYFDRLDNALTFALFQDSVHARISGTFDLEFYQFELPPPGLINSTDSALVNPRLTLFLDAQIGPQFYFFVQTRLDRGFDPSDEGAQIRLDEYALRLTPWEDGRLNVQIGTFATVVGNWIPRHLSWDNPFVNAPLVYENVTAVTDMNGNILPNNFEHDLHDEKYELLPVIWGPSYATGVSVSGRLDKFDYAVEMKNSALASRPESWHVTEIGFSNPTFNGRIGYRPSQAWNFGLSGSTGAYFRPEAEATLPPGRGIGDYRQMLIGQDASFSWHHLQIWAEFYEARFEVPRLGNADTFAYYLEAKYKITPQLSAAIRWNQQLFSDLGDFPGNRTWGQELVRVDTAISYRFTPHIQLKVQYGFQQQTSGEEDDNQLFAGQFTIRF